MAEKFVVGLTGGIASGKSAVSGFLGEEPGITVIDADVVSREIYKNSDVGTAILREFPECEENGEINRRKLRSVFADPEKTTKLNSITHPAIIGECKRRIAGARGIVLFVVPLLFETGMDKICDATVVVVADKKTRIKRLLNRDNIDEETAENMMQRQWEDGERIKKADFIIENDGDISDLKKKTLLLLTEIRKIAG